MTNRVSNCGVVVRVYILMKILLLASTLDLGSTNKKLEEYRCDDIKEYHKHYIQ